MLLQLHFHFCSNVYSHVRIILVLWCGHSVFSEACELTFVLFKFAELIFFRNTELLCEDRDLCSNESVNTRYDVVQ